MTELQKEILKIYKVILDICEKENIPFYAIGGTCIGAVRHKGFIPWDDDLDIAIPIEVYDKFISAMKDNLPDYLNLLEIGSNQHSPILFLKVENKNTTFIETQEYDDTSLYKGVFVDIMVLAGAPSNKFARKCYLKKLRYLQRFNTYTRSDNPDYYSSTLKRFIHKVLSKTFKKDHFSNKYINVLRKYPLKDSKYTGYFWSDRLDKLVYKQEWFADNIKMEFEDTQIYIPKGYDEFLTQTFGDYMSLPPIEQQVPVHDGFVKIDVPYAYYKEHPEKVRDE